MFIYLCLFSDDDPADCIAIVPVVCSFFLCCCMCPLVCSFFCDPHCTFNCGTNKNSVIIKKR